MIPKPDTRAPATHADFPGLGRVCRLGLALRGNTALMAEDVAVAVERGVNFLNWPGLGHESGLTAYLRALGKDREKVFVAAQFMARTADEAKREWDGMREALQTEYLDVLTYYYVESEAEWKQIIGPGGAAGVLEKARENGEVKVLGLTSHQRDLAAKWIDTDHLDALMIRYNAAHLGAERDVFPVAGRLEKPVVVYAVLRWGDLLRPTPEDPPGFSPPSATDAYRFALCHPSVTVALMAPDGRAELEANLTLLTEGMGMSREAYQALVGHGGRVRAHRPHFP